MQQVEPCVRDVRRIPITRADVAAGTLGRARPRDTVENEARQAVELYQMMEAANACAGGCANVARPDTVFDDIVRALQRLGRNGRPRVDPDKLAHVGVTRGGKFAYRPDPCAEGACGRFCGTYALREPSTISGRGRTDGREESTNFSGDARARLSRDARAEVH